MADSAKLTVSGLVSGYHGVEVLHNVTFDVQPGEIFALMGKNGMGKTTLLKSVLGLLRPFSGDIMLDGSSIKGKSPSELLARGVGYAPQEQPLFQDLSIRDNLRLALRSDRELKGALARVENYFPFLLQRLSQKAGTLSGGEQKMFILSRALMLAPKLILIDEISEGLQPSVVDKIAFTLKRIRDEYGTAILIVEQHLDFALAVADRWAILKSGVIDDMDSKKEDSRYRILQHLKI